jgi:hypothetical protein
MPYVLKATAAIAWLCPVCKEESWVEENPISVVLPLIPWPPANPCCLPAFEQERPLEVMPVSAW